MPWESTTSTDQGGGQAVREIYNDLYDATNNTIFSHMLKAISSSFAGCFPTAAISSSRSRKLRALYEHHVKIIEAIEARDGVLAKKLIIQHVNYLEKKLRKVIK